MEALASGRSSHPEDILTYFQENIQKNVHLVLCMNPYEPRFAEKVLKYQQIYIFFLSIILLLQKGSQA